MSTRTLRRWTAGSVPGAPRRSPGRPANPPEVAARVRAEVEEVLERVGWTAGEGTVRRALPAAPRGLVRQALKELKARRRAEVRRREEASRESVETLRVDVAWRLDATHLGRAGRREIHGQVLREAASRRTLQVTAGGSPTQAEVLALLESMEAAGRLPLVLATDNGAPYTGGGVERWLEVRGVVHLRNLPRTPRHNAGVERAIGELKAESGLGGGVELRDVDEALERLEDARARLDERRPRPCLGGRTAYAVDTEGAPPYNPRERAAIVQEVRAAVEVAVGGVDGARARRRAEREAVFRVLERRGLIRRTRGGLPLPSPNSDTISC